MTSTWATGSRLRQSILKTVRVGITRFISGTSKRAKNRGARRQKGTSMNALIAVILGAITVYLKYTRYARRIVRNVIQSDPKCATPFCNRGCWLTISVALGRILSRLEVFSTLIAF